MKICTGKRIEVTFKRKKSLFSSFNLIFSIWNSNNCYPRTIQKVTVWNKTQTKTMKEIISTSEFLINLNILTAGWLQNYFNIKKLSSIITCIITSVKAQHAIIEPSTKYIQNLRPNCIQIELKIIKIKWLNNIKKKIIAQ